MCLAAAYLGRDSQQPVLQDIDYMRFRDDGMEVVTLFGEERFIPGRVLEIDFSASKIILESSAEQDKV